MTSAQRNLLDDLLALPTSPFNERFLIKYIRRWAERRPGMELSSDTVGNLRLHLRRGSKSAAKPLVFSAHLDHPGFEAAEMIDQGRLRAIWRGGVSPDYFPGARVRFFVEKSPRAADARRPRGTWISGRITEVETKLDRGRKRVDTAVVRVTRLVPKGSIGMWNLPDPAIRGNRIFARGCDDVAGVAAVLAAFDELSRRRGPVDVYATFTRAEEVGFAGAIAACGTGLIPKRARIVAVECSSELPGVVMGGGPILRVGDYSSVFSPGLTAWCGQVARDAKLDFQRKLMDGGTCESAAFCELGFEATGLCVALGNYHNMDRKRKRIAAEYIDLRDWEALVRWFIELALSGRQPEQGDPVLRRTLRELKKRWTPLLRKTVRM